MVALRKESVDRNRLFPTSVFRSRVALRKESVDRNNFGLGIAGHSKGVALRKESVDRNRKIVIPGPSIMMSLSARRAWIEIVITAMTSQISVVALRKESVDRNSWNLTRLNRNKVALRKESVDRNPKAQRA